MNHHGLGKCLRTTGAARVWQPCKQLPCWRGSFPVGETAHQDREEGQREKRLVERGKKGVTREREGKGESKEIGKKKGGRKERGKEGKGMRQGEKVG